MWHLAILKSERGFEGWRRQRGESMGRQRDGRKDLWGPRKKPQAAGKARVPEGLRGALKKLIMRAIAHGFLLIILVNPS